MLQITPFNIDSLNRLGIAVRFQCSIPFLYLTDHDQENSIPYQRSIFFDIHPI